jgi:glycosyltransferase involved in cell wall biosynthesis
MTRIPRGAVVATHNRPAELARCVAALAPQVDAIVVVDNASDPPVDLPPNGTLTWVVSDPEQPPNLSRLWNVGIDAVRDTLARFDLLDETGRWDVAVVNDDATVPPTWFNAVAGAMRDFGADAASGDPFGVLPPDYIIAYGADAPMSVATRLAGWAFILRGEWPGARLDERLRWWYGDDEISLRARQAGGLVHVGGLSVPNSHADQSTTGELAVQAGKDRQTFIDITGRQPW